MSRDAKMIDVVTGLGEAFRQAVSEVTVQAYTLALADLPIEAVERAALRGMRECKFMPTVAELRDLAGGVRAADRPTLAWEAVRLGLSHGPYRHVDFDDPLTNATVRSLGGWPSFVERFSDSEAEKWTRKDFLDTYARLLSSGVSGDVCRPLAGLSEVSVVDGVQVPPIAHKVATGLPVLTNGVRPAISRRDSGDDDRPKVEFKKP